MSAAAARPRLRAVGLVILAVLVAALVLKACVVRTFVIPSASMEPTLRAGDRVAVSLITDEVRRGDVIVFEDTKGWLPAPPPRSAMMNAVRFLGLAPATGDEHLAKRVVGLPGDTVSHRPGEPWRRVNGVPLSEPYLHADAPAADRAFEVQVPPGRLWVLGDHRTCSVDSRHHRGGPGDGFVSLDDVVGPVEARVWPIDRWALVDGDASGTETERAQ